MITTRKLTISAMVVAFVHRCIVAVTQSVSFGAYQIRIATSLYALVCLSVLGNSNGDWQPHF